MRNEGGVTLTELMIAVALIGIGIMAALATFNGIHKTIQYSKYRTLATNIAQEKMQIIMQKPYYEVLVTTAPALRTDVTPNISYDPNYFYPDTLTEGGITFTRYTNVQVAQEVDGVIQVLNPMTPDTGIRQITVTVVWGTNTGLRALTLQNVLNNPDTAMASTWLKGVVQNAATGAPLLGALVNAAENIGWRDTTDNAGNYKINLVPGTFNFLASAPGYFTKSIAMSVPFNNMATLNFSLTAIDSGTVTGTAWIDNHPVISQVVASTGPSNGIEYVELYNPTTSQFIMGTNLTTDQANVVSVVFDASTNVPDYMRRQLVYISTYVPANGFFLISNTGTDNSGAGTVCNPFTIAGVTVQPNACWRYVISPNHAFQCSSYILNGCSVAATPNAGGFGIGTNGGQPWTNLSNVTKYDAIGWTGDNTTPNSYETAPAIPSSSHGMVPGEAFVRRLDTTSATSNSLGNAYDTDNNSIDFMPFAPLTLAPRTSATILRPETGTPAAGARVSITDGLSATSTASVTGNPPYARFTVPGVATGTWVVFIDSGLYSTEIDTVAVSANAATPVPNSATTPIWPATGVSASVLASNGVVGIISGKVTDVFMQPIAGGITINAGGANTVSGPTGAYALRMTTGTYDVTANLGNANAAYQMVVQTSVPVGLGDATQNVNFQLARGGQISGFVSRDGTNPLPGVAVVALDAFGIAHDAEASGNNGKFTLINLSTGIYTVQPTLDTKEISLPPSNSVTVTAGATVSVGTFTIVGAMGQVQGSVNFGGQPIKSGVLIVVSTQAISVPPPALSAASLLNSAYYADSSNESGTFSVDVRGSTTTTYNVDAFYMRVNNQTPVISTAARTNITVTAGQPTTGINFSW